jgi:hypothetical protein
MYSSAVQPKYQSDIFVPVRFRKYSHRCNKSTELRRLRRLPQIEASLFKISPAGIIGGAQLRLYWIFKAMEAGVAMR